jgi:hypothetical protein
MSSLPARFVLPLLACLLALTPVMSWAENIVQTSELTPQFNGKVQSVLFVGTSASHPDVALGNKQALVAAEMRKLLKAAGLQVFAMGIKSGETDVANVIAQSVAKFGPSHTISVTVPSGLVSVKRSTGETVAAKAYVIKTEVSDSKSRALIWTHTAEVEAGIFLGASNAEVAEAVVARMRADGLL